jgi:hypothetical protein
MGIVPTCSPFRETSIGILKEEFAQTSEIIVPVRCTSPIILSPLLGEFKKNVIAAARVIIGAENKQNSKIEKMERNKNFFFINQQRVFILLYFNLIPIQKQRVNIFMNEWLFLELNYQEVCFRQ